jgi:outer membrane protein TolC
MGQISEAKANLESASSQLKDATDSVISEVRQAVSDYRASIERMKATEFNVQLASEAVSQAKVRYENGVITNLDMLNAETSLAEAKLMNLQAIYRYIISKENLKKAAGARLWQKEG